jgi:hypothetical protein
VEVEGKHGLSYIVQAKIFVPKPNPVIEVVGESELVITPVPETIVHTPVPEVATFPFIKAFGLLIQSVCVVPALAMVGPGFTNMVIVETDGAHGAFVIVHAKTFVPIAKPEIAEVGDNEFEIIPVPETNVHAPVPITGALAVIVAVGTLKQTVWFTPALEAVGKSFTINATVDEEGEQGAFEIVQAKTFVPNGKPVIEVEGDNELVIVPPPETNVHAPVPMPGVLAFIKVAGEEIQSVCVVPALEVVGA